MKLEALDTLTEVRQAQEERLRESGEWEVDLAALRQRKAEGERMKEESRQGSSIPPSSFRLHPSAFSPQPSALPPVLDAYEDGACWRVWCVYCQQWHSPGRGAGHRVAHCHTPTSPYLQTGYTLRYAGAFTAARRREGRG